MKKIIIVSRNKKISFMYNDNFIVEEDDIINNFLNVK